MFSVPFSSSSPSLCFPFPISTPVPIELSSLYTPLGFCHILCLPLFILLCVVACSLFYFTSFQRIGIWVLQQQQRISNSHTTPQSFDLKKYRKNSFILFFFWLVLNDFKHRWDQKDVSLKSSPQYPMKVASTKRRLHLPWYVLAKYIQSHGNRCHHFTHSRPNMQVITMSPNIRLLQSENRL